MWTGSKKIKILHKFHTSCDSDIAEPYITDCVVNPENGELAVVDQRNKVVKLYALKTGQHVGSFGHDAYPRLKAPWSISAFEDGRYAVTDVRTSSVKIFSHDGRFERNISHGRLSHPRGIAVSLRGYFAITDSPPLAEKQRVHIFDRDGVLLQTIPGPEIRNSTFQRPLHVAIDERHNTVAVLDALESCVKAYDLNGRPIFQYGSYGNDEQQLASPAGICSDKSGNFFVADFANHRVHVVRAGIHIDYAAGKADGVRYPAAVTTSRDYNLVICDQGGVVRVFEMRR